MTMFKISDASIRLVNKSQMISMSMVGVAATTPVSLFCLSFNPLISS